jgi:hypothetical protein
MLPRNGSVTLLIIAHPCTLKYVLLIALIQG